jgi:hypothetical protein
MENGITKTKKRIVRRTHARTERLTRKQRIFMAKTIADKRPTWRLAVDAICNHGLAASIAEADDLLYEAKQLGFKNG